MEEKKKWKIREDLKPGQKYGINSFIYPMLDFTGDIIECTESQLEGRGYYYRGWYWTRDMVEPFIEEPVVEEPVFKFGDKVSIYNTSNWYTFLGFDGNGKPVTLASPFKELSDGAEVYIWVGVTDNLKHFKEVEEVQEVTMQEIADKMGIDVKNLKIVSEEK